jgi:hypothetical protein
MDIYFPDNINMSLVIKDGIYRFTGIVRYGYIDIYSDVYLKVTKI